jgi:hypothetical protein
LRNGVTSRGKTEQNTGHARGRSASAAHGNRKPEKTADSRPPHEYFEDFSISHRSEFYQSPCAGYPPLSPVADNYIHPVTTAIIRALERLLVAVKRRRK